MSRDHFESIARRLAGEGPLLTRSQESSSWVPFFYEGARRKHQLDTLCHLAAYGDLLIVCSAETGSGKTSLLKRAQQELSSELHLLYLSVDEACDLDELVAKLASLSSVIPSPADDAQGLISRCLDSYRSLLSAKDLRTFLMIDDADKLEQEVLGQLLSLLGIPDSESPLVVALSGSGDFKEVLKDYAKSDFHTIDLPRLKRDEIADYVREGLLNVGYDAPLQLSDAKLDALQVRSKGLPANINTYMGSVIFGSESAGESVGSSLPRKTSLPITVLVLIVVTLLASFIFVAHQHNMFAGLMDQNVEHEEALNNIEAKRERLEKLDQAIKQSARFESIPAVDEAVPSDSEEVDGSDSSDMSSNESEEVVDNTVPSILESRQIEGAAESAEQGQVSEQESEIKDGKDEIDLASAQASDVAPVLPQDEAGNDKIIDDSVSEDIAKESAPIDDAAETTIITTQSGGSNREQEQVRRISVVKVDRHAGYRDAGWLAEQGSNMYTLQVLGSYNEATAQNFVDRNPRIDLFYVESLYKGKPWYVVLHGVYLGAPEAREAKEQLPDSIQKEKPWVRSLKGLSE